MAKHVARGVASKAILLRKSAESVKGAEAAMSQRYAAFQAIAHARMPTCANLIQALASRYFGEKHSNAHKKGYNSSV